MTQRSERRMQETEIRRQLGLRRGGFGLGGLGLKRRGGAVETVPPTPVGGLSAEECAHGTDVTLMTQEVGLFLALGPESNGV